MLLLLTADFVRSAQINLASSLAAHCALPTPVDAWLTDLASSRPSSLTHSLVPSNSAATAAHRECSLRVHRCCPPQLRLRPIVHGPHPRCPIRVPLVVRPGTQQLFDASLVVLGLLVVRLRPLGGEVAAAADAEELAAAGDVFVQLHPAGEERVASKEQQGDYTSGLSAAPSLRAQRVSMMAQAAAARRRSQAADGPASPAQRSHRPNRPVMNSIFPHVLPHLRGAGNELGGRPRAAAASPLSTPGRKPMHLIYMTRAKPPRVYSLGHSIFTISRAPRPFCLSRRHAVI